MKAFVIRQRRGLMALAVSVALGGCGTADADGPTESASPFPASIEINEAPHPLERGTYYVDPDGDNSDMRVHLTLAADRWSPPADAWRGVAKASAGNDKDVLLTITTVVNLAEDGCDDASADPPVGPSVDDLASALAGLSPFEVREAPSDVSAYGYEGKHLVLAVPDDFDMDQCTNGNLFSWIEAGLGDHDEPFWGYGSPGTEEEIWILDVDGTRLMIAVMTRPGAAPADRQEMKDILESIRVEPAVQAAGQAVPQRVVGTDQPWSGDGKDLLVGK